MQFMHTLFVYDEELRGAYRAIHFVYLPGRVAQWVTCLVTDASLTADPGVAN